MERSFAWIGIIFFVSLAYGVTSDEVCHGALGCFSNDPPFDSALLPDPMLPEGRDVINVTYALYVRHQALSATEPNQAFTSVNVTGPHHVSYNTKPSRKWRQYFAVTRPTKMIIHDYGDSASNPWVFAMVERFLARGDCHVITVNWNTRGGAGGYYQAAANARVVGAEVAQLLGQIQEWKQGFEMESVHVIGHGMGAHAASYAGERLKVDDDACLARRAARESGENRRNQKSSSWWDLPSWLSSSKEENPEPPACAKLPSLGQITGLDPAGLWFESADVVARLDESDAIFVDVIHTDVMKKLTSYFGHGISRASGHIDFYPNGGYEQPGCDEELSGLEGLRYPEATGPQRVMDCNHLRAISYYLATILPNACPMTSFPCDSWNELCNAECTRCTHDFSNANPGGDFSPTTWLSYLTYGSRRRRTSAPMCLQLGPTSVEFWREHKRRAKLAETDVTNIKSFLKTSSTAPYCVKYVRVELELNEPWSEGTLSFRFTDSNREQTDFENVGRVSNWGSTSRPVYLVTIPTTFGRLAEVEVRWDFTAVASWWPGINGFSYQKSETRKELRLPLKKVQIREPPLIETTNYCSPRRRLRPGREVRFARCGSDTHNRDIASYDEQADE